MNPKLVVALFFVGAGAIVATTVYAAMTVPHFLGHREGCDLRASSGAGPVAFATEDITTQLEGGRWTAVRVLTYRLAPESAADLHVCADTGRVELVAGDAGATLVEARVLGHATTEQAARDAAAALQPEVRSASGAFWAWHPHGGVRFANGAGASMSFRVTVPAGLDVDARLSTDTGAVTVEGVRLARLDARTDTGAIRIAPASAAGELHASADTGSIEALLPVLEDAEARFHTDTGRILVLVPADASHGYRIEADTDTGGITLGLPDLRDEASRHRHRRVAETTDFDARAVQVVLRLSTDTGGIAVEAV